MQIETLTIAIIASSLVCFLRPSYALATYIAVLVWYPDYLRISIGTIDISASRIVVFVLLMRCLCDKRIWRKFIWSRLDTYVALSMIVYVVMFCITRPLTMALENRGGFLMDTWFAYMAVRLIVYDKATLISSIKGMSLVLAALAILGICESITGTCFFVALKQFRTFGASVYKDMIGPVVGERRYGLGRATGPFNESITFGNCFVMFLPLIWTLRHQRDYWGKLAYPLSGVAVVGALSSMSSGPWVTVLIMVFLLTMEKYKHLVKPAVVSFVLLCLFVELASNRPLYYVIVSYANPVGGASYQRAQIIDCAIEEFDQWWLVGYGARGPDWRARTGGGPTDVNNEFILAGVKYGILGVIALCSVLVVEFRGLLRSYKETRDKELKSLYWSLLSELLGIMTIWMGVSFFGQSVPLFYSFLGIMSASCHFTKQAKVSDRRVLGTSNNNLISASQHTGKSGKYKRMPYNKS